MSNQGPTPEDAPPTPPHELSGFQETRALLFPYRFLIRAFGVSVLAHLLIFGGLFAASIAFPTATIRFQDSRGVALLSRAGMAPPSPVETDDRDVLLEELPAPEELPVEGTDPAEETPPEPSEAPEQPADASDEEDAAGESEDGTVDEAALIAQREREAEEEAIRQAEARRRRRERERERERQEAERLAEEQRIADEAARIEELRRTDPMQLPPGQRYPEGTLNPVATDVGMWGPEGAQLTVILRNDRIRISPHRQSVEQLLQAFPDWRALLGGSSLNPLTDVDTMLIASANPRYLNQTFLAAVHRIPPEDLVRALGEHSLGGVDWEEQRGRLLGRPRQTQGIDPRVFYLPAQNLFVYSRPEFVPDLQRNQPTARGMEAALEAALGRPDEAEAEPSGEQSTEAGAADADAGAPDEGGVDAGTSAGEGSAPTPPAAPRRLARVRPDAEPPLREEGWVRGLIQLADFGGTQADGPAVVISTGNLAEFRLAGMGSVTPPQSLHASVIATGTVQIRGRLVFADAREVQAFIARWPQILEANRSALSLAGMYRPLELAEWSEDHNEAVFRFSIEANLLRRIATTVTRLMQTR